MKTSEQLASTPRAPFVVPFGSAEKEQALQLFDELCCGFDLNNIYTDLNTKVEVGSLKKWLSSLVTEPTAHMLRAQSQNSDIPGLESGFPKNGSEPIWFALVLGILWNPMLVNQRLTPSYVLPSKALLMFAARYAPLSPTVLESLVEEDAEEIGVAVCLREKLDTQTQSMLLQNGNPKLLEALAHNLSVPEHIRTFTGLRLVEER